MSWKYFGHALVSSTLEGWCAPEYPQDDHVLFACTACAVWGILWYKYDIPGSDHVDVVTHPVPPRTRHHNDNFFGVGVEMVFMSTTICRIDRLPYAHQLGILSDFVDEPSHIKVRERSSAQIGWRSRIRSHYVLTVAHNGVFSLRCDVLDCCSITKP